MATEIPSIIHCALSNFRLMTIDSPGEKKYVIPVMLPFKDIRDMKRKT